MNLLSIFRKFPDQEACVEHLEGLRFRDGAYCPLCGSVDVARKCEGERIGRWNCHDCKGSFNVLSKTIFQKTRIDLQKWFIAVGLMVNAKKSLSSCQLSRDIQVNQKSAWYMMERIRAAMAAEESQLLQGIIEADETYIGGKPRKGNRRDAANQTPNKRGRGTKKIPVIGAVERGGRVHARVADGSGDLTGRGILRFIQDTVTTAGSVLITDEFKAYRAASPIMRHAVIKHKESYAEGMTHTNTIEGFWSLVKRAFHGQHHHYSRNHLPMYIAEACWKYNNRRNNNCFETFLRGVFA